jgi:hypothetical protein
MGRMVPRSERREKDLSTPVAGLERSKYETGPTSTGTVLLPSYISLQALFFIKENSMPHTGGDRIILLLCIFLGKLLCNDE